MQMPLVYQERFIDPLAHLRRPIHDTKRHLMSRSRNRGEVNLLRWSVI